MVGDADPTVTTGGVGTVDLVLHVDTLLPQVAAEVTSEARPVGHSAVPGGVVCKPLGDF